MRISQHKHDLLKIKRLRNATRGNHSAWKEVSEETANHIRSSLVKLEGYIQPQNSCQQAQSSSTHTSDRHSSRTFSNSTTSNYTTTEVIPSIETIRKE